MHFGKKPCCPPTFSNYALRLYIAKKLLPRQTGGHKVQIKKNSHFTYLSSKKKKSHRLQVNKTRERKVKFYSLGLGVGLRRKRVHYLAPWADHGNNETGQVKPRGVIHNKNTP